MCFKARIGVRLGALLSCMTRREFSEETLARARETTEPRAGVTVTRTLGTTSVLNAEREEMRLAEPTLTCGCLRKRSR
jgi:hypothetical protein